MKSVSQTQSITSSRVRDYVVLCKPRIAFMVVLTVMAGGLLSGAASELSVLLNAALGVVLIAASGCAMNQYLERYTDFLMVRTARRPLPGGRLSAAEVVIFAAITFGTGVAVMLMLCNWTITLLGIATWVLYVWVYTPLKIYTIYNTMVGAIPGALPILIGAAASDSGISFGAWSFFVVLLIWQFPHFMAIAWLYRRDYAEGGIKMITVTDPSGFWAGVWAVGFGSLLIPASVLPAFSVFNFWGQLATVVAGVGLGTWFLIASIRFARSVRTVSTHSKGIARREHQSDDELAARRLLRVSLLHLPLYMLVLMIASLIP